MAERTFSIANVPQYAYNSTTGPARIATGASTRKTMLQIQANPMGPPLRIIEWGISSDASALQPPTLLELVETGVQGATGSNWTSAKMPIATLSTAITSTTQTSLALNNDGTSGHGGNLFTPFYGGAAQTVTDGTALIIPIIGTTGSKLGGPLLGGSANTEMVLVTAISTDTLTATRNVDGRGALAAAPIGSVVMGMYGQFEWDIVPDNYSAPYPPSSVIWQNCGWNSASTAPGTDLGSVTQQRYLAPPVLFEPIGGIGPTLLPLSREPEVQPGCFARVVVTPGAAANVYIWLKWSE
jgi:hypothetical protein